MARTIEEAESMAIEALDWTWATPEARKLVEAQGLTKAEAFDCLVASFLRNDPLTEEIQ